MSHMLANSVIFIALRSLHASAGDHSKRQTLLQHVASTLTHSPIPSKHDGGFKSDSGTSSPLPSGKLTRNGMSLKQGVSSKGMHDTSIGAADKDHFAWSKAHHVPTACVHLVEDTKDAVHLLLNPFTLNEVRNYMCKALNCKDLPEELVSSVYQVSTGSPYWCKQIANFISERGQDLFISTASTSHPEGDNSIAEDSVDKPKVNPLHVLIICRLENMTVEQQAVIKHASIIGEEFHAALLERILPHQLKEHLIDTIAVLVNNCLLFSDNEDGDTYKFGNHLIHQIIYDLTPPSEAAKLHKLIGDSIEEMHTRDEEQDVVVYYQLLIYHYTLCPSSRAKAFKYLVKACDQCSRRKAYEDVVKFATRAKDLANSRTELKILQAVVDGACDAVHNKKETRKIFGASTRVDNSNKVISGLEHIDDQIAQKLEEMNLAKGDEGTDRSSLKSAMQNAVANSELGSPSFANGDSTKSPIGTPSGRGGSMPPGRHSIALQRQKSRQLDWESEVMQKTAQQLAEQEEASKVRSGCVIS